jgi:hypothetical protein
MKVLGRYSFVALTIPKGARKPRRELLFGTMEHEVREIALSEMVADAVVVSPFYGPNQGLPERRSYFGWEGALWRPLTSLFLHREVHQARPVSADELEGLLRSPFPVAEIQTTPLDLAYEDRFGPANLPRGENSLADFAEENYQGSIVSAEKSAAIERHRTAALSMVVVDGMVYERAFEPYWRFSDLQPYPGAGLRTFPHHDPSCHGFRLDRLHHLQEWLGDKAGRHPVRGEIHHLEPEFLRRDDLSHFVNAELNGLFDYRIAQIVPFMSDEMVAVWSKLNRSADRDVSMNDRPYEGDLGRAVNGVTALYEALLDANVPTKLLPMRNDAVRPFARFLKRVKFELATRPRLETEDEVAIEVLSAGPTGP